MDQEPAYHLDIPGMGDSAADRPGREGNWLHGRPWLGVHFECCGVYARVYRNAEGTAYTGRCPRCTRRLSFRVGRSGTNARFFTAY